jgi:EcsC family protein
MTSRRSGKPWLCAITDGADLLSIPRAHSAVDGDADRLSRPADEEREKATMRTVATGSEGRWEPQDVPALRWAFDALEHPGFLIRLMDFLGRPIEGGIKRLPPKARTSIQAASRTALQKALNVAVTTMKGPPPKSPRLARGAYKAAVAGTGGVAGFFGLPALGIELPVTTIIMLRAIADIARAEGEDVRAVDTQLACIEVFALGGQTRRDDSAATAYFEVRTALAGAVSRAAEYIAEKGLAEEGAPILLKLITRVAQRFSVQVSEKVAAEAVPIIGALGGATINVVFIDHFQSMARGHFTIRRLERTYGPDAVRVAYEALRGAKKDS